MHRPSSIAAVAPVLAGITAFCASAPTAPLAAQTDESVYYRGRSYGSEALFTPFSAVLNSGFYNFQIDNRGDEPFAVPYTAGFRNVAENLLDPFGTIGRYGWSRFLTSELLPNLSQERGQWVPNYLGHILGEGMVYRTAYEWYRQRGYPNARVLAILTQTAGALLNEAVENGDYEGSNVDPIADFYLFNPLGILLFSSDRAARFLHDRVGLVYWPHQVSYDPHAETLSNVGYRIAARFHPGGRRLGAFAMYGTHTLAGASYRLRPDLTLSIGAGAAAHTLEEVPGVPGARTVTATLGPAAGIFVDREGSLLASLLVAPGKEEPFLASVYPGVVGLGEFRPGITFAWHTETGPMVGINVRYLPIGFMVGAGR